MVPKLLVAGVVALGAAIVPALWIYFWGDPYIHTRTLTSADNVERTLHIYLPAGYEEGSMRYPVIYGQDGNNLFASQGGRGRELALDAHMEYVHENYGTRQAIIVGVAPINRNAEYDPESEEFEKYQRFLVEEVKPFIDSEYRTLEGKQDTFLFGASLGAVFSLATSWKYPHVFSKAVLQSIVPMFFYDENLEFSLSKLSSSPQLYFDAGDQDADVGLQGPIKELIEDIKKLKGEAHTNTDGLIFHHFPGTGHDESSYSQRLVPAVQFLLGN